MASAPEQVPAGARIPDFFIVGHPKSGTTALYEMLRRHPQIFMPDVKEPRFFDSDLRELVDAEPYALADYLELFAPAREDQLAGEASPSYLRSRVAAGAIAALQPRARCIAIFREPASFVRSLHLQLVQDHIETEKDLARALAAEELDRGGQRVLRYADRVHYVEQLRRFHETFPPEQVLTLVYDDFRTANEATVRRVLRFLGVDDEAPIHVLDANPTVAMRSVGVDRALRTLYAGRSPLTRATREAVRALTPHRARTGAMRMLRRKVIYGRPAPPDAELMAKLRDRFRDEVLAFSEYLDRDLVKLWGYDRLD